MIAHHDGMASATPRSGVEPNGTAGTAVPPAAAGGTGTGTKPPGMLASGANTGNGVAGTTTGPSPGDLAISTSGSLTGKFVPLSTDPASVNVILPGALTLTASQRASQALCRPFHAVWRALLGAHVHRMLIGACTPMFACTPPMLCPIRGTRAGSRSTLRSRGRSSLPETRRRTSFRTGPCCCAFGPPRADLRATRFQPRMHPPRTASVTVMTLLSAGAGSVWLARGRRHVVRLSIGRTRVKM